MHMNNCFRHMGHTLLIFSIILCMVLLQSCKENYSNGEKVGNLIEFTQKGVIYDSWEGRLNMDTDGYEHQRRTLLL